MLISLRTLLSVFLILISTNVFAQLEQKPQPEADNKSDRAGESQKGANKRLFSRLDFISNYCTSHRSSEQAEWRKAFICESKITDVVIAVFTIALTGFTGLLVIVGGKQARLTRETLINTQRAFVFATGFQPLYDPPERKASIEGGSDVEKMDYIWRFRPHWQNSGDTPTKDFISHTRCELRDSILPPGFDFDYSTEQKGGGLIGPHFTVMGGLAPQQPSPGITTKDILDVQAGRKHLYLWGWARYFDVFPNTPRHISRFCWFITPTGNPLTYHAGQLPSEPDALMWNFVHHFEGNNTSDEGHQKK